MNRAGLYAGWIVVDVRLLVLLILLSCGLSLLLLALLVQRRAWHEYLSLFLAITGILFGVGLLLLQTVLNYPVFVERAFFPLQ